MKCPVCPDSTLSMSNREGIEIDYCPKCRGVWLDRGELDKIIERSANESQPTSQPRAEVRTEAPYPPRDRDYDERYRERDHDDRYRDQHYHKRKRKGLLGELFDFD